MSAAPEAARASAFLAAFIVREGGLDEVDH